MNRVEACEWQDYLFGDMTLPEICIEARQAVNGAADPWSDEQLNETVAMLKARLETWAWPSSGFDKLVRDMVAITIYEVESR